MQTLRVVMLDKPAHKLMGLDKVIHQQRDHKLEEAREERRLRRRRQHEQATTRSSACRIDFRQLRRQVSIQSVLQRQDYWECMRGSQPQLRGPCPVHGQPRDESHRSFSVNTRKNVYRCFHRECNSQGNALDLWAAIRGLPIHEAAINLGEVFHVPLQPEQKEKRNS